MESNKRVFKSIALKDCHEVYESSDCWSVIARWGLDLVPLDSVVEINGYDCKTVQKVRFSAPFDEDAGEINWEAFDEIVKGIVKDSGFGIIE